MPFPVDADAGWTPLYLSTIAGMSTCLGALIGKLGSLFVVGLQCTSQFSFFLNHLRPLLVFCHPIDEDDEEIEDLKEQIIQLKKSNDEMKKMLNLLLKSSDTHNITYNIHDSAISGNFNIDDDSSQGLISRLKGSESLTNIESPLDSVFALTQWVNA